MQSHHDLGARGGNAVKRHARPRRTPKVLSEREERYLMRLAQEEATGGTNMVAEMMGCIIFTGVVMLVWAAVKLLR